MFDHQIHSPGYTLYDSVTFWHVNVCTATTNAVRKQEIISKIGHILLRFGGPEEDRWVSEGRGST